jgi:hypothetical protein
VFQKNAFDGEGFIRDARFSALRDRGSALRLPLCRHWTANMTAFISSAAL